MNSKGPDHQNLSEGLFTQTNPRTLPQKIRKKSKKSTNIQKNPPKIILKNQKNPTISEGIY
jgi:hypothetical protein